MSNTRFQTVWRLAVLVCAALAVFTVIFVSCTKAPEGAPARAQTESAPATEQAAPTEQVQPTEQAQATEQAAPTEQAEPAQTQADG